MSQLKVLKLKEPIQFGSDTIDQLEIRKPKAGDMRSMPTEPKMTDLLDLGGRLCGQPPSVINELGIEDMMMLLEIVGNFIPTGRRTGNRD